MFKRSSHKYLFNCNNCLHTFSSSLDKIYKSWCPYCSNPPKLLCNNINCNYCFLKSFASYEKSKYIKDKNINIRNIFISSMTKLIFICNNCNNEYINSPNNVSKNIWCNCIKNKTESKLYNIIKKDHLIIKQFKTEWCKNKTYLPFDFLLPKYNIIIELDGIQHFYQVSNWKSPDDQFENDVNKIKKANDNNYCVIRILQEDVLKDKFDWYAELTTTINKILNDKKIQNIFICKNNEYDKYKQ